MLIKLTNTEGREFWLNAAHILTIGRSGSDQWTVIKLTNREAFFEVVEEPESIVKLVNKTKGK